MRKYLNLRQIIGQGLIFAFLLNSFGPVPLARARDFRLPAPGIMVHLSPEFNPPILKGIKVHPDNPFRFDFILDQGDGQDRHPERELNYPYAKQETGDIGSQQEQLKQESTRLIKYFLASLTIPEKDLWVNLSPYERDRIIPQGFGLTEMGRDLLAEDYMLKQITASLIYPEGETGKKFWNRIYEEAQKKFGTTNIPVNTFNKVWIVPEKAVLFENAKAGTAYVVESKLKVMLEQDYLSLQKHNVILSEAKDLNKINFLRDSSASLQNDVNALGSQIVREIVIPELTKEVNQNKNFARLRQVYNSLILATWYKKKIKDSILEQVYTDKKKVVGVNIDDPEETQRIYQRYLQAFKKGVYNYIKEEQDSIAQQSIPRKYFSGGFSLMLNNTVFSQRLTISHSFSKAMLAKFSRSTLQLVSIALIGSTLTTSVFPSQASAQVKVQQKSNTRSIESIFDEIVQKQKDNDHSITFAEEDEVRAAGKEAVDILLDKLEKALQKNDRFEISSAVILLGVLHDEKALDELLKVYEQFKDDEHISLDVLFAMTYYDRNAARNNNFIVPKQLIEFYLKSRYREKEIVIPRMEDLMATEWRNIRDGERMEEILKEELKNSDPEVRAGAVKYAIWAKSYRDNMPAYRQFLMKLEDDSPLVREAIMGQLDFRFIKDPEVKERLRQVYLNDPSDNVRLAALKSLSGYDGDDLLSYFMDASSNKDPDYRTIAVVWLGRVHGQDPGTRELISRIYENDVSQEVRKEAYKALEGLSGKENFDFFMEQAESQDPKTSSGAFTILHSMILRQDELFPTETADDRSYVLNLFDMILRDGKFPTNIHYGIGSVLIDVYTNSKNSREDRDRAKEILKGSYRLRMTTIASQLKFATAITQVINRSIDALVSDDLDRRSQLIKDKYGRAPQGIIFYLTIPQVVLPIIEAGQRIGKGVDLYTLTAGSFAEGFIEAARGIINDGGKYLEDFHEFGPMGLNVFSEDEAKLKRYGMLRKDYEGFDGGTFTDVPSLLEAFWAVWLQHRARYLSVIPKDYLNNHQLSRQEIEAGTYASFVSADFNIILKRYGFQILGAAKKLPKAQQQHGVVIYNAQWPPATDELMRSFGIFGDRAMAVERLNPNEIFNKDDHDFMAAVKYFNENIIAGHSFESMPPLTWEQIINLYEIFRGDRMNPHYTKEIRDVRLTHYPELAGRLTALANTKENDREELLDFASELYFNIINRQDFSTGDKTTGIPGFNEVFDISVNGKEEHHPAAGHHRLAWFIMNYFLISNGYTAFYFRDEQEYVHTNYETEIYNPYELLVLLNERVHFATPAMVTKPEGAGDQAMNVRSWRDFLDRIMAGLKEDRTTPQGVPKAGRIEVDRRQFLFTMAGVAAKADDAPSIVASLVSPGHVPQTVSLSSPTFVNLVLSDLTRPRYDFMQHYYLYTDTEKMLQFAYGIDGGYGKNPSPDKLYFTMELPYRMAIALEHGETDGLFRIMPSHEQLSVLKQFFDTDPDGKNFEMFSNNPAIRQLAAEIYPELDLQEGSRRIFETFHWSMAKASNTAKNMQVIIQHMQEDPRRWKIAGWYKEFTETGAAALEVDPDWRGYVENYWRPIKEIDKKLGELYGPYGNRALTEEGEQLLQERQRIIFRWQAQLNQWAREFQARRSTEKGRDKGHQPHEVNVDIVLQPLNQLIASAIGQASKEHPVELRLEPLQRAVIISPTNGDVPEPLNDFYARELLALMPGHVLAPGESRSVIFTGPLPADYIDHFLRMKLADAAMKGLKISETPLNVFSYQSRIAYLKEQIEALDRKGKDTTGLKQDLIELSGEDMDLSKFMAFLRRFNVDDPKQKEFHRRLRTVFSRLAGIPEDNIIFVSTKGRPAWMPLFYRSFERNLWEGKIKGETDGITDNKGHHETIILVMANLSQKEQASVLLHESTHAHQMVSAWQRIKEPLIHFISEGYQLDAGNELLETQKKYLSTVPDINIESKDFYPVLTDFVNTLKVKVGQRAMREAFEKGEVDLLSKRLGKQRFQALLWFLRLWQHEDYFTDGWVKGESVKLAIEFAVKYLLGPMDIRAMNAHGSKLNQLVIEMQRAKLEAFNGNSGKTNLDTMLIRRGPHFRAEMVVLADKFIKGRIDNQTLRTRLMSLFKENANRAMTSAKPSSDQILAMTIPEFINYHFTQWLQNTPVPDDVDLMPEAERELSLLYMDGKFKTIGDLVRTDGSANQLSSENAHNISEVLERYGVIWDVYTDEEKLKRFLSRRIESLDVTPFLTRGAVVNGFFQKGTGFGRRIGITFYDIHDFTDHPSMKIGKGEEGDRIIVRWFGPGNDKKVLERHNRAGELIRSSVWASVPIETNGSFVLDSAERSWKVLLNPSKSEIERLEAYRHHLLNYSTGMIDELKIWMLWDFINDVKDIQKRLFYMEIMSFLLVHGRIDPKVLEKRITVEDIERINSFRQPQGGRWPQQIQLLLALRNKGIDKQKALAKIFEVVSSRPAQEGGAARINAEVAPMDGPTIVLKGRNYSTEMVVRILNEFKKIEIPAPAVSGRLAMTTCPIFSRLTGKEKAFAAAVKDFIFSTWYVDTGKGWIFTDKRGLGKPEERKARLLKSLGDFEWKILNGVDPDSDSTGGIDLTPAKNVLQTQNAGQEIKFHMDPAMLQQLQNAPGFVPVIINIQPLKSLQEFLGV